ncbi:hypothetical protein DY000_02032611 [Brassica cretica]|uniref:Uncharacterized protein n=1 Tax=Brassica cretica TaxID=69181 RepID=A0ABQ7DQF8_BRACR|nr:hypothetical protein DY000_02032611 [Brassica cretica]
MATDRISLKSTCAHPLNSPVSLFLPNSTEFITQPERRVHVCHALLCPIGLGLIIRDPDSIRDPLRIRSENRISGVPGSESG